MADFKTEYPNGDLRVIWRPGKCEHAGVCAKMLPNVYNAKAQPWIKADNATIEELKNQIDNCPSGALSYYTTVTKADSDQRT